MEEGDDFLIGYNISGGGRRGVQVVVLFHSDWIDIQILTVVVLIQNLAWALSLLVQI